MASALNWMPAHKLVEGYAKRKFSPVDVARACLKQIEKHDGVVNAMVGDHAEEALKAAKASEKRWKSGTPQGPIDGVPVLVKDLLLDMRIDPKIVKPSSVASKISEIKDRADYLDGGDLSLLFPDYYTFSFADLFEKYHQVLANNRALDFNDLIIKLNFNKA